MFKGHSPEMSSIVQVGLKSKLVNLDFLHFLSILCLLNHENQEKAYFIFHLFMLIYS